MLPSTPYLLLKPANVVAAAVAAFVGPVDVISNPVLAYCLRAASSAKIGANVLDIKRASDSTTQTFVSLADGSLDIASITTFLNATSGTVTKWYDQSANANHLVPQTTAPAFVISASGLGTKPSIDFTGTRGFVTTSSVASTAQPYFISAVWERTGAAAFAGILTSSAEGVGGFGLIASSNANAISVYGGSPIDITAADNVFHAVAALLSASPKGYVNGSSTTAAGTGAGAMPAATNPIGVGNWNSTSTPGLISEAIYWASDQSASASSLSSNQRGSTGYNF